MSTTTTALLTGDTYPHRVAIRAAGGTWDKKAAAWTVPAGRREALQALVDGGSGLRTQQQAERTAREEAQAAERAAEAIRQRTRAEIAARRAAIQAEVLAEVSPLAFAATASASRSGRIKGPYKNVMPTATVTRDRDGAVADYTPLCHLERTRYSGRLDLGSITVPLLPEGWTVRVSWHNGGRDEDESLDHHPALAA